MKVLEATHPGMTCLTNRLKRISLMPHDVGGSGNCLFLKSVSHVNSRHMV